MNFKDRESPTKLRGGYYTPLDLAVFITRWVMEIEPKRILEPSCGDGAFIQALAELSPKETLALTALEINGNEAQKARAKARVIPRIKSDILTTDFLHWSLSNANLASNKFDAVVGNPPFVRYQYLPSEYQTHSEEIFSSLKLPFTKHTNAWVPFVLASIKLLRPGGRLGMIVPSELLHIPHAQSLRTYLTEQCSSIHILDPTELWFDGTLQGAQILLVEKKVRTNQPCSGIGVRSVPCRTFSQQHPTDYLRNTPLVNGATFYGKWTRALLTPKQSALFEEFANTDNVRTFKEVASVDVGIVTGANKFFLVPDGIVSQFGLDDYAYPMFGRSEHCPGVIYDHSQHSANAARDLPTNFIWIKREDGPLTSRVRQYLKWGEKQGLHKRYKCRIRNPWYSVPSVYSTPVCMLKRTGEWPRLIFNRLGAYTTDTAYRITPFAIPPTRFVYTFPNALTALSAELEGRHYGGGVLELVPSEIERLLVPIVPNLNPALRRLDRSIRFESPAEALSAHSDTVLSSLGVSKTDREELLSAWLQLRNRRHRQTQ